MSEQRMLVNHIFYQPYFLARQKLAGTPCASEHFLFETDSKKVRCLANANKQVLHNFLTFTNNKVVIESTNAVEIADL